MFTLLRMTAGSEKRVDRPRNGGDGARLHGWETALSWALSGLRYA